MNAQDLKGKSETDWERVDALADEEIDTSDIPPLDEAFFERAELRLPGKTVPVTLDVDADVLEWFRAQGEEFQKRVNAALRIYADAHREQSR
jgi:uncharacterized protein (DUF4415 family)